VTRKAPCKRPYSLVKRSELSDQKRVTILTAARKLLESEGLITLENLARASLVTRQTIHNLFGTKAGVVEALFDQLAMDGGMQQMRGVMQQPDPEVMLHAFVKVFTGFWNKDRIFLRRIHGIAAIDPELGAALAARNQRRQMAARRIVDRMGKWTPTEASNKAAILWALTSFEFYDVLAGSLYAGMDAARLIMAMVTKALAD
jgi:AcrR family transcriptional regulator